MTGRPFRRKTETGHYASTKATKDRHTILLTPWASAALDFLRRSTGKGKYVEGLIWREVREKQISETEITLAAMRKKKEKRHYRFTSETGLYNVQHFLIGQDLGVEPDDAFTRKVAGLLKQRYGASHKTLQTDGGALKRVRNDYARWERNGFLKPKELDELKWRQMAVDLQRDWIKAMK